jgi:hypothetical protein
LHPAFKNTSGDLDCVYIGAYLATDDGNNVYGSLPGKPPVLGASHVTMLPRFEALNTGGVAGFHMLRYYEWAVLQWLTLVEFCTSDIQAAWATGTTVASRTANVDDMINPVWRNLWGLWGRLAQRVMGLGKQDTTHFLQLEANDGSGEAVTTDFAPVSYTSLGGIPVPIRSMHTGRGEKYDFGDVFFPDGFTTDLADASFPDSYTGRATINDFGPAVGGHTTAGYGGMFMLNIGNSPTTGITYVGSRVAKYGEPVVYDAPVEAPKDIYFNRSANVATLRNPGNVLRVANPAGAVRLDVPRHIGQQPTYMRITLEAEVCLEGEVTSMTMTFPCMQDAATWPCPEDVRLIGGRSGYVHQLTEIRTATDSDGIRCIIFGDGADELWETDEEPILAPFLYIRIQEVTLLDPEDAYLDPANWTLSMTANDTSLEYSDSSIYVM